MRVNDNIHRIRVGATLIGGCLVAMATSIAPLAIAEPLQPCTTGQVAVSNGGEQGAAGHRRVVLIFGLTPGSQPCVLSGFPNVETGGGGPLLRATETMSGYMGGVTGMAGRLPLVPLSRTRSAEAIVEGMAADDHGNGCPTYTELRSTPPGSTASISVPVQFDVCDLQVHPVTSTS